MPQRHRLPGVEFHATCGEQLGHMVRKGEVHVVAAHQQVVTDRQPAQFKLAVLLGDIDQRQVGCPAADIAHQQSIALR